MLLRKLWRDIQLTQFGKLDKTGIWVTWRGHVKWLYAGEIVRKNNTRITKGQKKW